MTAKDLLRHVIDNSHALMQVLPHCVVGAKMRKGGVCRVEFETTNMTANDLMYFASDDKPAPRKPKYVGVVLWVPFDEYMRLENESLAAESASFSTGGL